MNAYRQSSIYVSEETMFYLKCYAKAKVKGTDAAMSSDQVADCLLRKILTEDQPELVNLYSELASARIKAKDSYKDIEERSVKFLSDKDL